MKLNFQRNRILKRVAALLLCAVIVAVPMVNSITPALALAIPIPGLPIPIPIPLPLPIIPEDTGIDWNALEGRYGVNVPSGENAAPDLTEAVTSDFIEALYAHYYVNASVIAATMGIDYDTEDNYIYANDILARKVMLQRYTDLQNKQMNDVSMTQNELKELYVLGRWYRERNAKSPFADKTVILHDYGQEILHAINKYGIKTAKYTQKQITYYTKIIADWVTEGTAAAYDASKPFVDLISGWIREMLDYGKGETTATENVESIRTSDGSRLWYYQSLPSNWWEATISPCYTAGDVIRFNCLGWDLKDKSYEMRLERHADTASPTGLRFDVILSRTNSKGVLEEYLRSSHYAASASWFFYRQSNMYFPSGAAIGLRWMIVFYGLDGLYCGMAEGITEDSYWPYRFIEPYNPPYVQEEYNDELWDLIAAILAALQNIEVDVATLLNPDKPDEDEKNPALPPIPWWTPGDIPGNITGTIPDTTTDDPAKEKEKEKEKEDDTEIAGDITVPLNPEKPIEQLQTPQIWDRFPFCLPYDLINLIKKLNATGEAPKWEIPFDFSKTKLKYNYTFTLDLAPYEPVAKTVRTLMTIFFIGGLVLITRNMIRG